MTNYDDDAWTLIQMSESEDLRDILYNELANLTIFMRLLRYAVARQKMVKCFSVSIDLKTKTKLFQKYTPR